MSQLCPPPPELLEWGTNSRGETPEALRSRKCPGKPSWARCSGGTWETCSYEVWHQIQHQTWLQTPPPSGGWGWAEESGATWGPPHVSPKLAPTPNLCPTLGTFRGHIPEYLFPVPALKGTPGERLFSQQSLVLSPWVSQPRGLSPGQGGALGSDPTSPLLPSAAVPRTLKSTDGGTGPERASVWPKASQ